MKKTILITTVILSIALTARGGDDTRIQVKPIEGTWINLAYQDVRNKYTNNLDLDYSQGQLWTEKVGELARMGMRYLVFMAVANEGKAYYPSRLMPHTYPEGEQSPVDAILSAAAENGLKVFMSTGWAKDQDDNLQDPEIKHRQLQMMEELAELYGGHPAMYGWYLPVEDCLCPLFKQHAVDAVNALTAKARQLTPGKKTLISPYGIVDSAFDNPEYEKQIAKLNVDIIAYQDEVGCVREQFPLVRLRDNWRKLADIHSRLNIEMWANCETFTWEKATNDRTSALIPAAYPRLLAQQAAASAVGAKTLISFMFPGIIENPESPYRLGQPVASNNAYREYMSWREGDRRLKLLEATFVGTLRNSASDNAEITIDGVRTAALNDNLTGQEHTGAPAWTSLAPGYHEIVIDLRASVRVNEIMPRFLSYHSGGVYSPSKIHLFVSDDGSKFRMAGIAEVPSWPNDRHDAWIETALFGGLSVNARYLKLAFRTDSPALLDEIYINPYIASHE